MPTRCSVSAGISQHSDKVEMNQQIRKLFYTYRNGIVADALRSAGDSHRQIFGLQLPQIGAIAREVSGDLGEEERNKMAKELWAERECRESRLLAPYLFNVSLLGLEDAAELLRDCSTPEETDILVFRCLRNHPGAGQLREMFAGTYSATALSRFL